MNPTRLFYATPQPGLGNLGDTLGPVIVAALSGRVIRPAGQVSLLPRLASIGTIAQRLRFGWVDLWGSGAAGRESPFEMQRHLRRPWATHLVPHATRGPFSAALLAKAGFGHPAAFGDPAWLLPQIWPRTAPPRFDLGVILHGSEVTAPRPDATARPEFRRYDVPPALAGAVRIISPLHAMELGALRGKLNEMLDCRRILSTSLHDLVLAEAYGIPCAAFDFHAGQSGRIAVTTDTPLDHRMRDFYAGVGQEHVLVLRQERHEATDWEAAIRFLDREWSGLTFDATPLLESFPRAHGRLSSTNLPAGMAELARRLRHVFA